MDQNRVFMQRCFQLALKGEGFTKPNPVVGAVVVHDNKIIGEGYHRHFGGPHAEVNAINSVKNQSLLTESTLYVSLEPCAHQGKTPPCAELIISKKIPRVVIAVKDPNPQVSGRGVKMMREAGIEVVESVLEEEARNINRFFFTSHELSRPFVVLKWAQTKDGFIDSNRSQDDNLHPVIISNKLTHSIVHRFRTRVQGILVGTNTAILDNPQLTSRKWYGGNPTRITIDRENKIPRSHRIFDGKASTIIFTETTPVLSEHIPNLSFIEIDFSQQTNKQILNHLYQNNIYSVLVEGGSKLLTGFIQNNLWDEAYIEVADITLSSGVKAPEINGSEIEVKQYLNSSQFLLKRKITRNIL